MGQRDVKAKPVREIVVLLLIGSLAAVSCGPMGASPTNMPTPHPVATLVATAVLPPSPASTVVPSPLPLPTSTSLPRTPQPSATPVGGPVEIEIIGESPEHTVIKPGETAVLPYWQEYVALVHYPGLLGSFESGSFQPYPVRAAVSNPGWQAQIRNYPDGQTLNLHLLGSVPGMCTITVDAGPKVQPVSFTLRIEAPAPTATATVAPSPVPAGTPSVTLADDGHTIELHTSDRFLLALGEGFDWNVEVADPTIVGRVVGVLVVRGAQGIYEAKQPGTTALTATGDPLCRRSRPACEMPSRLFRVQLTVH